MTDGERNKTIYLNWILSFITITIITRTHFVENMFIYFENGDHHMVWAMILFLQRFRIPYWLLEQTNCSLTLSKFCKILLWKRLRILYVNKTQDENTCFSRLSFQSSHKTKKSQVLCYKLLHIGGSVNIQK